LAAFVAFPPSPRSTFGANIFLAIEVFQKMIQTAPSALANPTRLCCSVPPTFVTETWMFVRELSSRKEDQDYILGVEHPIQECLI
jgi:hypothetical protein